MGGHRTPGQIVNRLFLRFDEETSRQLQGYVGRMYHFNGLPQRMCLPQVYPKSGCKSVQVSNIFLIPN